MGEGQTGGWEDDELEFEIELDDLSKDKLAASRGSSVDGIKLRFSDPTDNNSDDENPFPNAVDTPQIGGRGVGDLWPLAPITLLKLEEEQADDEIKTYRIPPWGLLYILYVFAAYLVVSLVMVLVLVVTCAAHPSCGPSDDGVLFVSALEIFLFAASQGFVIAGAPIFLSIHQGNGPVIDFGLTQRPPDIACGLGYGLICIIFGFFPYFILGVAMDATIGGFHASGVFAQTVYLLLLIFGVPVIEEILFRGFIFTVIAKKRWHKLFVIALNAFLFALFQAFYTTLSRLWIYFVLGIILATARVRTQSLTPCIIARGVFNLASAIMILVIWTTPEDEESAGEDVIHPLRETMKATMSWMTQ